MSIKRKMKQRIQNVVIKIFKIRNKEEIFVTRPGPDADIPKYVNERIRKENADLQAKLLDSTAKLDRLTKERQRKKDELEERQRMAELKKITQKSRNSAFFQFVSKKKNRLPTFYLKSNKVYKNYKRFWGIEIFEDADGYVHWYPLLTNGKKTMRFAKPAADFKSFFRDQLGIVSQLKGGKLDSMFDIYEGKPVLATPKYVDKHQQQVEIIHLAEQEAQKYEQTIELYKKELGKVSYDLEDAMKREVKYQNELGSVEISIHALEAEVSAWKTTSASYAKKYSAAHQDFLKSALTIQDLAIASSLDSKALERYQTSVDTMREKIAVLNAFDSDEIAQQRFRENINLAAEAVKQIGESKGPTKVILQHTKKVPVAPEAAEGEGAL